MEEEKKSKPTPWLVGIGLIVLIGIVVLFVLAPNKIDKNDTNDQGGSVDVSNQISSPEDDLVGRIDSLIEVIALSTDQFALTPLVLDGQEIMVTTDTQTAAIEFIADLSGVTLKPGVEATVSEKAIIHEAALKEFRDQLPQ